MHDIVDRLVSIKKEIQSNNSKAEIVAISKTFPLNKILPLINFGHLNFGENKVQEAVGKWTDIKKDFNNIKLHFVGKLQTNKVKYALPLFDYIHSLDTIKLAEKIANEQQKKNFKPKIFIQVNIGKETQKNGVEIENLEQFYLECKKNFDLNIIGLMCLPPNEKSPNEYFSQMQILKNKLNLDDLSMGMTNDYIEALNYEATFIRIGSKIFGERG
jgi:pyridoxal phosphate enzyme (YggS family)